MISMGGGMETLSYRDAARSDLAAIVGIYNSTIWSRTVTADTEPVSVESRVGWFAEHSPLRRPLWVVEDADKRIVGWVSFQSFYGRPAYDATAEISIYLEESRRGKGIGRRILQHSIAAAPRLGIKTLLGFIFAHNEPSLRLFHRLGFEDWATLPNVAMLDEIERSVKILGKRVA
jgi:phosphinothricin acetyltransferase